MRTRKLGRLLLGIGLLTVLGGPYSAHGELFVVDSSGNKVLLYNQATGAFQGSFVDSGSGGLAFPRGAAVFGADGNFYVASSDTNSVLRYSGLGGFLGTFANATNTPPGFGDPTGMASQGDLLYVADETLSHVKTYNVRTGAFVGVFASGNGLSNPEAIAFGPDGNLYVTSQTPAILRFNGTTGAFIGALANGSSGLQDPRGLAFGPDGNLYVADPSLSSPGRILRYDIVTGSFKDVFVTDVSLQTPRCLTFGPSNDLYVGDASSANVRRYDGTTGANKALLVSAGSGGLVTPVFLLFAPPYPDSDADGVPDLRDTCPGTPTGSFVDANGCPGSKLNVSFHWWGILSLVGLFGALHLRLRRKLSR